eukprot:scaffold406764_cov41-Prasinocladus_malaysianus.AAC.1
MFTCVVQELFDDDNMLRGLLEPKSKKPRAAAKAQARPSQANSDRKLTSHLRRIVANEAGSLPETPPTEVAVACEYLK